MYRQHFSFLKASYSVYKQYIKSLEIYYTNTNTNKGQDLIIMECFFQYINPYYRYSNNK